MTYPFTAEQRALWEELKLEHVNIPEEEAISSFRFICGFEGIEKPSAEAIRQVLTEA